MLRTEAIRLGLRQEQSHGLIAAQHQPIAATHPFAGPAAVLAYLSRYTHRVAIANSRLLAMDERGITFRWKDYRAKGSTRHKTMTLEADEFMRRFLLHVLPGGFHRIRHYGLLANAGRRDISLRYANCCTSSPPHRRRERRRRQLVANRRSLPALRRRDDRRRDLRPRATDPRATHRASRSMSTGSRGRNGPSTWHRPPPRADGWPDAAATPLRARCGSPKARLAPSPSRIDATPAADSVAGRRHRVPPRPVKSP